VIEVPSRLSSAAAALAAALLAAGAAADSHALPWLDPDAPLPPSGTSSLRVVKTDLAFFTAPSASAPRRGSAAREARLPFFATRRGAGCPGAWLEVGPLAWACDDGVEMSTDQAIEAGAHTFPDAADGLPYRYYFVGPDGSSAYKHLEGVDIDAPDMALEPGFAVAIVAERTVDAARYGRTEHGLWVPMRDLGAVHSFAFRGVELADAGAGIHLGWVIADKVKVLTKPSGSAAGTETRARFEQVPVLDETHSFAGSFVRIGDGAWLRAADVAHPTLAEPPPEIDADAGERWLDIDLGSQTLVAYEGRRPVFATLVSTGKGRQGTELATPKGTHRIWIKLLTSDMDNLEDENAARYYRIEDVPWVQYFSKGVGLHGAFWHRSFGHVRSHGCVNLAPLDAQRLFWWTSPHLPAGWTAVLPTPHEGGTVVRVR
jgi:hypothetical protein